MANKIGWFLTLFFGWIVAFGLINSPGQATTVEPSPNVNPVPVVPVNPPPPEPQPPLPIPVEPDCVGVQVPIPKDCRVYNKSGSQCVWCSIECLGRYHGVKEVFEGDRRLTKTYTWATNPGEVYRVMSAKYPTVKWKQITNRDVRFIKKYVTELKLGIGLAIPGHMLNLVHYDEEAGIVKVIDNCGPKALQVQDWTMDRFNRLWDGWALVVFPPGFVDPDNSFDVSFPAVDDKLYGSELECFLKLR